MALQIRGALRTILVPLFVLLVSQHCWQAKAWEHSEPDDLGDFDVEVDMEEDMVLLDDSTFKYAVESKEFLLVLFYAPWCDHCKKALPEFSEAATTLMARESMEEKVWLGKVDATANPRLATKYSIKQYPTYKFFAQGVVHKKDISLHTSASVLRFIHKKTNPPVIPIETKKDLKRIKEEAPFIVVGYFDQELDTDAFKTFALAAVEDDYSEFFYVWDKKIMKKEGITITPTLMIYRQFDTPEIEYTGTWDQAGIELAISTHKQPTVIDLNGDTTAEIFKNKLPKVLLVNPDEESMEALMGVAKQDKHREKYLFVTVDEAADPEFRTFLGSDQRSKDPEVWIYSDDMQAVAHKYLLEPDYTTEKIEKFMKRFEKGKLKEKKTSAKVKAGWDAQPVKELVSSQWNQFVNQDKHVVLEFYLPECNACKSLQPKYEECARYFEQEFEKDIVVARIDASENEPPAGFEVEEYPSVFLMKRGKKSTPRLVSRRHFAKDDMQFCKRLLKMLDMLNQEEDTPDSEEGKSEL